MPLIYYDKACTVTHDNDTDPKFTYEYDAKGRAAVVTDAQDGGTIRNNYDSIDRPTESEQRDGNDDLNYRALIEYDARNRVSAFGEATAYAAHKTKYTYDKDNRVTQVQYDGSDSTKVSYTYDKLNRITQRTVTNGAAYATQYGYAQGAAAYGSNATTPLINAITQGSGANALNFSYTYDSRGNITSETRNGVTTTYEYDALGQLVRVNDPNDKTVGNTGTTWAYAYDRGGNILRKTAYAYTTGEPDLDVITKLYEYNDTNWKDKLTKFDGNTITYDAIGNPLSGGTWTYTWQAGRQLRSMSKTDGNDTITMEFTYNHAGLRTKKVKKVNGTVTETTEYILNGKNVVDLIHTNHATSVTNRLHFFYDTQDKQAMVEFNGVKYSYAYNLQGDVVGIVDSTGGLVVQYSYDAWGKPISTTASSTLTTQLAELNPFRYRGYIWDKETRLYYLRSRYYAPEIGRFLNTDYSNGAIGSVLTHNQFTYCINNPIYLSDDNGTWPSLSKLLKKAAQAVSAAVEVVAEALPVVAAAVAVAAVAVAVVYAAPLAVCTLTTGLAVAGVSTGVATVAANIGVVTAATLTIVSAADTACVATTGVSPVREYVFQGNQDAYEAFQMVSATASAGLFSAAAASPGVCFVAGTPITTENGFTPIEQIVAGQLVWAEDPETGEKALKRVIRTFVNEKDELIHIGINGETITCTTEHPFYVIGQGWIAANELKKGDQIEQQQGLIAHVEIVDYEKLDEPVPVYNFEVEEFHTYFVGARSVLVHNACSGDGKPADPKKLGNKDISRFDAHAFKETFVGRRDSPHFDIYNDRKDSILWLGNKQSTIWHNTEMSLGDVIINFPKKWR